MANRKTLADAGTEMSAAGVTLPVQGMHSDVRGKLYAAYAADLLDHLRLQHRANHFASGRHHSRTEVRNGVRFCHSYERLRH